MIRNTRNFFIILISATIFVTASCGRHPFKSVAGLKSMDTDSSAVPQETGGTDVRDIPYIVADGISDLAALKPYANPDIPENLELAKSIRDLTVKHEGDNVRVQVDLDKTSVGPEEKLEFLIPKSQLLKGPSQFSKLFSPTRASQSNYRLAVTCLDANAKCENVSALLQNYGKDVPTASKPAADPAKPQAGGGAPAQNAEPTFGHTAKPPVATAGFIFIRRPVTSEIKASRSADDAGYKPNVVERLQQIPDWTVTTTAVLADKSRIRITDKDNKLCFEGEFLKTNVRLDLPEDDPMNQLRN